MRLLKLYGTLFSAIFAAVRAPRVRALLAFCLLISGLQAVVFAVIEGWPLVDGFYFAVVTMATVGYGDLVPQTMLGKLVSVGFMFVGIGIFVLTFSAFAQEFLRKAAAPDGPGHVAEAGVREGRAPPSPVPGGADAGAADTSRARAP